MEFGKGLWFENRMEKSLISPNQCQKFGIQICDNPTDSHRKLRIEASEDLFTPMTMKGSTCGIATHPPTEDELHECQNILLSDIFYWDPSQNFFDISSMEEEYDKFKFLSMVISFRGLDKYESNHTGDGQTDGQTRTKVRTGNIYMNSYD